MNQTLPGQGRVHFSCIVFSVSCAHFFLLFCYFSRNKMQLYGELSTHKTRKHIWAWLMKIYGWVIVELWQIDCIFIWWSGCSCRWTAVYVSRFYLFFSSLIGWNGWKKVDRKRKEEKKKKLKSGKLTDVATSLQTIFNFVFSFSVLLSLVSVKLLRVGSRS